MNFYNVNELASQTEIPKLNKGGKIATLYIKDGDLLPDLNGDAIILESIDASLLLPEKIYIYGKGHAMNDALYCNKWHPIWTKTIKEGYLIFYQPYTNNDALQLGFSYEFRKYKGFWRLEALIQWLTLLFDKKIKRQGDWHPLFIF